MEYLLILIKWLFFYIGVIALVIWGFNRMKKRERIALIQHCHHCNKQVLMMAIETFPAYDNRGRKMHVKKLACPRCGKASLYV